MKERNKRNLQETAAITGCWIITLFLLYLVTGCTRVQEVRVPEIHTDTLRLISLQHDSTYVHDSVFVSVTQHLDTVYLTKHITHYRDRIRYKTDTLYNARVDTVTQVQYVEKENRSGFMQRIRTFGKDICVLLLLLGFLYCCYKVFINNRNL